VDVVVLVLVLVDTDLLLLLGMGWREARHIGPLRALTRENVERARSYSAATTTTATTRDAAQIDCATLGEHELNAG
jgi:hypothetical protein